MEGKISGKSLHPELAVIMQRVKTLEAEVKVLDDDVHEVRPEYLKKLEEIEKTAGSTGLKMSRKCEKTSKASNF